MVIHLAGWTAVIMHAAKPSVYLPFKCKNKYTLSSLWEQKQHKPTKSVLRSRGVTLSTSLNCFSLAAIYVAENFKGSFHILYFDFKYLKSLKLSVCLTHSEKSFRPIIWHDSKNKKHSCKRSWNVDHWGLMCHSHPFIRNDLWRIENSSLQKVHERYKRSVSF